MTNLDPTELRLWADNLTASWPPLDDERTERVRALLMPRHDPRKSTTDGT